MSSAKDFSHPGAVSPCCWASLMKLNCTVNCMELFLAVELGVVWAE